MAKDIKENRTCLVYQQAKIRHNHTSLIKIRFEYVYRYMSSVFYLHPKILGIY